MAGYGGFGPSKFEQSVDGGLSNVGTALFGNPLAAGRMAYQRARAGLENQQTQDAAQKAAAQAGLAAQLHGLSGAPIQPGMVDDMLANGALMGDNTGMGGLFLSRNANTGQIDPIVARSFVGAGHAVGPTDAFSLPGQGAIIQGQNTQADHIQQATAASAFAQAVMGQNHEDARNAATNAQSGANNTATIAGAASRDNNSPLQLAQAALAAGKATPDQLALLHMAYPTAANADQPIKVTPADGFALSQEVDSQLGGAAAAFQPQDKAAITAKAIAIYQDKTSPAFGNPSLAVQTAISTLTQPGPPETHWFKPDTPTVTMKPAVPAQPGQPAQPAAPAAVPTDAAAYLKQHPELAQQFDAKYGAGASKGVLGQ